MTVWVVFDIAGRLHSVYASEKAARKAVANSRLAHRRDWNGVILSREIDSYEVVG